MRFNAGLDLAKLGDLDGVPAVIEGLGHYSGVLRNFHAGKALIGLGEGAVPALSTALDSDNVRIRTAAANILHQIDGTRADELLSIALGTLYTDDWEATNDAYALLGRMGDKASASVPRLTATLQEHVELTDPQAWEADPRVRAAGLLAQIANPLNQVISALTEALESEADSLRWSATRALGTMGSKARPAAPALSQLALDEDEIETVRVEAAYSLARVGDEVSELAPTLSALLRSRSWWVRAFAARIVGEPALQPRENSDEHVAWSPAVLEVALPALSKALADRDYNVRRNATLAVSQIGTEAAPTIPALIEQLKDDATGPVAAEALAQIGQAAIPALVQTLDDDDTAVSGLASYALNLIDTPATRCKVRAAERRKHFATFQPLLQHLLPQVHVVYDDAKLQAFEALHQRTLAGGQGTEVFYNLGYPKHEFLRFLLEVKGLLMHGSNKTDIDLMHPIRHSTDAGEPGNVSGVYAARDYIQPMYFAIVNRQRCFTLTNGFCDQREDGTLVDENQEVEIGIHRRFYWLSIDHKGIHRKPWRSGMLYVLPSETFEFWGGQYTSRVPVRPLMKIAIHPDDHPLLDEVWGYEYFGVMRVLPGSDPDAPFHFLRDVDAFAIRTSGKPVSGWPPLRTVK